MISKFAVIPRTQRIVRVRQAAVNWSTLSNNDAR